MAGRSGAHRAQQHRHSLVGERAGERWHQRTAFARWRKCHQEQRGSHCGSGALIAVERARSTAAAPWRTSTRIRRRLRPRSPRRCRVPMQGRGKPGAAPRRLANCCRQAAGAGALATLAEVAIATASAAALIVRNRRHRPEQAPTARRRHRRRYAAAASPASKEFGWRSLIQRRVSTLELPPANFSLRRSAPCAIARGVTGAAMRKPFEEHSCCDSSRPIAARLEPLVVQVERLPYGEQRAPVRGGTDIVIRCAYCSTGARVIRNAYSGIFIVRIDEVIEGKPDSRRWPSRATPLRSAR